VSGTDVEKKLIDDRLFAAAANQQRPSRVCDPVLRCGLIALAAAHRRQLGCVSPTDGRSIGVRLDDAGSPFARTGPESLTEP
jgi:hypothetical protein